MNQNASLPNVTVDQGLTCDCLNRNETWLKVKVRLFISVFKGIPLGVTSEHLENPGRAVSK